jgi:hypothetical protein
VARKNNDQLALQLVEIVDAYKESHPGVTQPTFEAVINWLREKQGE